MRFVIPGRAQGKGRPRFARVGQHVRTYTDDKTARYENLVALAAREAGCVPLDGPVALRISVEAVPPESWSKKRRAAALEGAERPRKPDLDNCAKAIMDGLNGVAYRDDVQVGVLVVTKRYAATDCVIVTVGGL